VGNNTLTFTYDVDGRPVAVTYNGTTYFYATNIQGDVLAIMDADEYTVVAYSYDAWGKLLSVTGSMASTLGALNPLRYRGYVYDTETGLYYVSSRYYDPEMGRWINADGFVSTGQGFTGNNMFAYCGNNPVLLKDTSGMRHEIAVGGFGYAAPFGSGGFGYVAPSGGGGGGGGTCSVTPSSVAPLIIPFVLPTTTSGIDELRAEVITIKKNQVDEEAKVRAMVIHNTRPEEAIYYGAAGKNWKIVTPPMTPEEAKMWAVFTAVAHIYGKGGTWGLYTPNQSDALSMAWDLSFAAVPISHTGKEGEYPHYHVFGFDFMGVYKHFHLWYGTIYEG